MISTMHRVRAASSATHHQRRYLAADQIRPIAKVRLKWVKNRGFDHIIDRDTSIKAAVLLKDFIKRAPSFSSTPSFVSSRSLQPLQKPLGLTVPVLRFLRRYPTLFSESPHPRYPALPTFRLADTAFVLDSLEREAHFSHQPDTASRLARLLMMTNSRSLSLKSLAPLKYDLGLPDDFLTSLIPQFPHYFRLSRRFDGLWVELAEWQDDLAVSELQKMNERAVLDPSSRHFCRGSGLKAFLVFPMSFPRGYGAMNKVKAWMEEFDRLPYISPYEDVSRINPESEIMEKHVVGVLHELLSLTIHKKTKRNYLRCLREVLNLPEKFTRVFTRYPGIFYLSLKCKTTTVMLREGYQKGKLVTPHPLSRIRDKYYYVMRTGIMYRGKAAERLVWEDEEAEQKQELYEGGSEDEEYCEGTASEEEVTGSDDD